MKAIFNQIYLLFVVMFDDGIFGNGGTGGAYSKGSKQRGARGVIGAYRAKIGGQVLQERGGTKPRRGAAPRKGPAAFLTQAKPRPGLGRGVR